MTPRTQDLLREALALPDRERADIAAQLIASLDAPEDPATIEAEWAAEIERRAARVLTGDSPGESWDAARRRAAERLRER